jgi:BirA family biotin operon repressor/biotin-[acetyl-CoA-carboxylase] ligase
VAVHAPPSDLAAALAEAGPRLGPFADVRYYTEVASTNDIALQMAARGVAEGASVVAESQRAGRGRRGRAWFSPPGAGLYLSTILRPRGHSRALPLVTLAAGVAVARAIDRATGLPVELKWPNDMVAGRPWRKLGGVLCESVGVGATVDAVVVGIGLNLQPAAYPIEIAQRATSLETELGRPIDRAPVMVEVLSAIAHVTGRLWAGDFSWICDEWRRFGRAGLGGGAVRWTEQGEDRRGIARDIDETGALVVDTAGQRQRLVAGEVLWERLGRD